MATCDVRARLDVFCTFTVNEDEARALDALSGYGDDAFVNAFYEKLGQAYMREHEKGLREFLKTIRGIVGPAMHIIDESRKHLKEKGLLR